MGWLLLFLFLAMAGVAMIRSVDEPELVTDVQSECVVFDIDGTLTPEVLSIKTAREGAATAVRAFADSGYLIVYLSARIPLLQGGIRDWLEENGFPPGRLHVTESRYDREDHAAFKKRVLEAYTAGGCGFVAAYGDSSSDFEAYASVGISPQRIFALKREGKKTCQTGAWAGCYATWGEQM
ncbi:MAG: hypothetical protein WBB85_20485, partial [Albidovulum sp.]|uniref:LNS2 domain-containing protein n=1 Tax=Albidovulum sp. TaxID=1872424 RepID=UPI003C82747F